MRKLLILLLCSCIVLASCESVKGWIDEYCQNSATSEEIN